MFRPPVEQDGVEDGRVLSDTTGAVLCGRRVAVVGDVSPTDDSCVGYALVAALVAAGATVWVSPADVARDAAGLRAWVASLRATHGCEDVLVVLPEFLVADASVPWSVALSDVLARPAAAWDAWAAAEPRGVLLQLVVPAVGPTSAVRAAVAAAVRARLVCESASAQGRVSSVLLDPLPDATDVATRLVEVLLNHHSLPPEVDLRTRADGPAAALRSAARIIEGQVDPIFTVDDQFRVTSWNAAAERVFGVRRNEILGQPVTTLAPPERANIVKQRVLAVLQGDDLSRAVESFALHRDGRVLPVTVVLSRLEENSRPVGVSAIVHLSRRREPEAPAETGLGALAQLAGGVAHDVNNLLTVVWGGVRDAVDSLPASSRVSQSLRGVLAATEQTREMTERLLVFGQSGTRQPVVLRLAEWLPTRVRRLEALLRHRQTLSLDIRAPGVVFIDPLALTTALSEVVRNATEAMPEDGALLLSVDEETSRDGTVEVVLRAIDNGAGMAADQLTRVFDPFFTTKPAGQGAGLGMSCVWGVVSSAKGRVEVASAQHVGTEVTLRLPAMADVPDTARTVLVVSSDPRLRRMIHRMLHRTGWDIVECVSGEEAVDRVRERASPRLLVMMEASTRGWSVAHVRSLVGHQVPVVGLVGPDDPPLPAPYVEMPFTIDELRREVDAWVPQHAAAPRTQE